MSLFEFKENLFLEYKTLWFLWEPAWESFRPISAVQWDGYTFVIDDRAFCMDPSDEFYGYGTEKMKTFCDILNETVEAKEDIRHFETPEIGPLTWFRDRFVSVVPCTPMDAVSWKRMHRGKYRTCRKVPRGKRMTRRRAPFKED